MWRNDEDGVDRQQATRWFSRVVNNMYGETRLTGDEQVPDQVIGELNARWRRWRHLGQLWKVMPSLVVCEVLYGGLAGLTLWHGKRTDRMRLWWSCLLFGWFKPWLQRGTMFWYAQSSVMVTNRMPLWVLEMNTFFLYVSAVAARKLNITIFGQAALTGLLTHSLHTVHGMVSTRYLHCSYHDSHPLVAIRFMECVPFGVSLWTMLFSAVHSFFNRWMTDEKFNFVDLFAEFVSEIPQAGYRKIGEFGLDILHLFDRFQQWLMKRASLFVRIIVSFFISIPSVFNIAVHVHCLSLDRLGIPGHRSNGLLLTLFSLSIFREMMMRRKHLKVSKSIMEDKALFYGVGVYYLCHLAIRSLANPTTHISTGLHQPCSTGDAVERLPILNRRFRPGIPPTGPCQNSRHEFSVPPPDDEMTVDPSGATIRTPKPEPGNPDRYWYTIYGREGRKSQELASIASISSMGLFMFWKLLFASSTKTQSS